MGDAEEKVNGGVGEASTARSEMSYPAFGLEEAVRFAAAVQGTGGNEATEDDVRGALGLTSRTSRAWTYRLSTAREFGLVERSGRAADARIRITELYKKYALPENDAERRTTLMTALLRPALYKKLVDRYSGAPLPSAQGVASILEREYGLLPSVKNDAAEAFLSSLRFAGATTNNTVTATAPSPSASPPPAPAVTEEEGGREQPIRVPAEFVPHSFQLRRGMRITMPLPPDLTQKDVERLYRWMKTLPIEDEEEDDFPGKPE
jgi:hypothetical protein